MPLPKIGRDILPADWNTAIMPYGFRGNPNQLALTGIRGDIVLDPTFNDPFAGGYGRRGSRVPRGMFRPGMNPPYGGGYPGDYGVGYGPGYGRGYGGDYGGSYGRGGRFGCYPRRGRGLSVSMPWARRGSTFGWGLGGRDPYLMDPRMGGGLARPAALYGRRHPRRPPLHLPNPRQFRNPGYGMGMGMGYDDFDDEFDDDEFDDMDDGYLMDDFIDEEDEMFDPRFGRGFGHMDHMGGGMMRRGGW